MFGQNFSHFCYALNGNSAFNDKLKVVFLFPYINDKQRTACQSCVTKYGGEIGNNIPAGTLPVNLFETGELYLLGGYCQIIECLNTLSLNTKIDIYIGSIIYGDIIENKPTIRNMFQLNLKTSSFELRKNIVDYYTNPKNHTKSFRLQDFFDVEECKQPIIMDYKTIIHFGDYTRTYQKSLFLKECLNRRVILRDVDIARPATSFGIEDDLRLAVALSENNHLPVFTKQNPQEAGAFVSYHGNVVLSYMNADNEPEYLYFNKDYIPAENYKKTLYDFISLYMNKVDNISVKKAALFAFPKQALFNVLKKAIIYDRHILPVGVQRNPDLRYPNIFVQPQDKNLNMIFHSDNSLQILDKVNTKLKKTFPFYYYGVTYYENNKDVTVVGINTLKTSDLGMVCSYMEKNRYEVDQYIIDNKKIRFLNIAKDMPDKLIASHLNDLMSGFARNSHLFKDVS